MKKDTPVRHESQALSRRISFRLPSSLDERLKEAAERARRTPSDWLRLMIEEALEGLNLVGENEVPPYTREEPLKHILTGSPLRPRKGKK